MSRVKGANALPGAYVHVPFCRHRCGYCNFTLVARRDDLISAYLKAVEKELQLLVDPRPVRTIYIGGGTPTHLDVDSLRCLLNLIRHWFPCDTGIEFSIEANPHDVSVEKIGLLSEFGVNRISLGVQSFLRKKLERLERDHDADTVLHAVELIQHKIENISIDLIFATPDETMSDWSHDLSLAFTLPIKHVSTYGLTIERGTTFWNRWYRSELSEVDDELQRSMYETGMDKLASEGFEHYEVSNFARPGFECQHNNNYWLGGQYYAVGPGAARFLDGRRSMNHRSTTTYIKRMLAGQTVIVESESLTDEELARERLVFGLRRLEGIDLDTFQEETGYSVQSLFGDDLVSFCEKGFLDLSDNRLRLTRSGLLVSDSIWPRILVP